MIYQNEIKRKKMRYGKWNKGRKIKNYYDMSPNEMNKKK